MKKLKTLTKVAVFSLTAFLTNISIAFAATKVAEPIQNPASLNDIIDDVQAFVLYLGGVIVLIMFVIAGIIYMTAGGNEKKVESAKLALRSAIIGLAIILGVYFLIQVVSSVLEGNILGG